MTLNERIKETRQFLGLTQEKFAERLAISISYLSEMERAETSVNDRIIRLIALEFAVSEYWLRSGEGEMLSDSVNHARASSLFKSLTPSFQEFALIHLEALADLQNRQ